MSFKGWMSCRIVLPPTPSSLAVFEPNGSTIIVFISIQWHGNWPIFLQQSAKNASELNWSGHVPLQMPPAMIAAGHCRAGSPTGVNDVGRMGSQGQGLHSHQETRREEEWAHQISNANSTKVSFQQIDMLEGNTNPCCWLCNHKGWSCPWPCQWCKSRRQWICVAFQRVNCEKLTLVERALEVWCAHSSSRLASGC